MHSASTTTGTDNPRPHYVSTTEHHDAPTHQTIILISEDAHLQQAVRDHFGNEIVVVTRLMLLASDWLSVRDQGVRQCKLILVEFPAMLTGTGTRNDRRVMDRILQCLQAVRDMSYAVWAPRGSNVWDMSVAQGIINTPGTNVSYHQTCSFGATSPLSGAPLKRCLALSAPFRRATRHADTLRP